jgi:hypothetical protein
MTEPRGDGGGEDEGEDIGGEGDTEEDGSSSDGEGGDSYIEDSPENIARIKVTCILHQCGHARQLLGQMQNSPSLAGQL